MIWLRELRFREPPSSYAAEIPAVRALAETGGLCFHSPVTFLAGGNGSGKSTLLEAAAAVCGLNPEGGSRDNRFATQDTHSDLADCLLAVRGGLPRDGYFLRAESFYGLATYLDQSGSLMTRYGGRSLHSRSHGEAFLTVVSSRFEGRGLYLLDEPEAALSPQRQLSLLVRMRELEKQDSQFIIATHSPILLAYPGAEILRLSEKGIEPAAYRDTEQYRVTKDFLDAPERMLRLLFEEEENRE